jgi:hypothetical protein
MKWRGQELQQVLADHSGKSRENAVLTHPPGFFGRAIVLTGLFIAGWGCSDGCAQGSIGGTIGKTEKSVSGTQSSEPERPAHGSKPASSARPTPVQRDGGSVSSFDGTWAFTATGCGAGTRQGVISAGRISIGDGGGRVSASGAMRVSFTTMTGVTQVAVGRLSRVTGSGTYSRPNGCAGSWTATKQ